MKKNKSNQLIKQNKVKSSSDDRSRPKIDSLSSNKSIQPIAEWIGDKTIKVSLV
jgi:hypothetical protein